MVTTKIPEIRGSLHGYMPMTNDRFITLVIGEMKKVPAVNLKAVDTELFIRCCRQRF